MRMTDKLVGCIMLIKNMLSIFFLIYFFSVGKTKIKCKTSRLSNRRRRSTDTVKSDGLLVFFDGSPPVRSPDEKFLYVPDPNITNITPRYTFPR